MMSNKTADTRVLLIRHPEVAARYRGVCYGRSDIELSPQGERACSAIAEHVVQYQLTHVVHSDLQRSRLLAECIGQRVDVRPTSDPTLRERDFGTWEMQSWNRIYADCGDDISKMMSDPDHFRPGGGETTSEFADRVWGWSQAWNRPGTTIVVTHGGTIAALLGRERALPVFDWPSLTPGYGEMAWHVPQFSRSRI